MSSSRSPPRRGSRSPSAGTRPTRSPSVSTLRLVLDTNVWLDWLVFDDPGVVRIRDAVRDGDATVFVDAAGLAELERVLAYPLVAPPLAADARAALLATVREVACLFERTLPAGKPMALPLCRDADDQKFLELARDCSAHVLVTRDRALLELGRRRSSRLPFRILDPSAFAA